MAAGVSEGMIPSIQHAPVLTDPEQASDEALLGNISTVDNAVLGWLLKRIAKDQEFEKSRGSSIRIEAIRRVKEKLAVALGLRRTETGEPYSCPTECTRQGTIHAHVYCTYDDLSRVTDILRSLGVNPSSDRGVTDSGPIVRMTILPEGIEAFLNASSALAGSAADTREEIRATVHTMQ